MTNRATAVNPEVLRWAREQLGYSPEDMAKSVGRPPSVIEDWEAGRGYPTYRQLEKLARKVRRPVAVFFFPEPPSEPTLEARFRTLRSSDLEALDPSTRLSIRYALARQQSLRELTGGLNPVQRRITRALRASVAGDASALASQARDFLGISLSEQQRWPDLDEAFKNWRNALEMSGVYVFKGAIRQLEVSGFCLQDDEFPVIFVNNSVSRSRQIFTLFHELAHLLFGVSSITWDELDYIEDLPPKDREIEIACNRFAAEFLVPSDSFPWGYFSGPGIDAKVRTIASNYKVSREVILRRLRTRNLVSQEEYERLASKWAQEFLDRREELGSRGSGGDYYNTQIAYLGDNYLRLAFERYHAGAIDLAELSEHLGMKVQTTSNLEDRLLERA